jgi:hypothetical protein
MLEHLTHDSGSDILFATPEGARLPLCLSALDSRDRVCTGRIWLKALPVTHVERGFPLETSPPPGACLPAFFGVNAKDTTRVL